MIHNNRINHLMSQLQDSKNERNNLKDISVDGLINSNNPHDNMTEYKLK